MVADGAGGHVKKVHHDIFCIGIAYVSLVHRWTCESSRLGDIPDVSHIFQCFPITLTISNLQEPKLQDAKWDVCIITN